MTLSIAINEETLISGNLTINFDPSISVVHLENLYDCFSSAVSEETVVEEEEVDEEDEEEEDEEEDEDDEDEEDEEEVDGLRDAKKAVVSRSGYKIDAKRGLFAAKITLCPVITSFSSPTTNDTSLKVGLVSNGAITF